MKEAATTKCAKAVLPLSPPALHLLKTMNFKCREEKMIGKYPKEAKRG